MKKINSIIFILLMVFSCFIPLFSNVKKVEAMVSSYTYAYIDAIDLGPRSCPSTDCSRIYDDEGYIIWMDRPRTVEVIGYSGDWAKIKFNFWGFTYTGYVLQKYLGNKKTVTLDENYANSLRSKGFPESYIESLTKMHAIHPKWNFEVSETGVSLSEAVDGEYNPIYKNLMSTSNTTLLSTDPGAYNNGSYTAFEPGWYAPSKDTLKYYLDPRNFLDDNSIFMFEQLSYNSSVTESDIQSMLNNSFMSGSFNYNGQNYTYARAFLEVGRETNVNPVHLAARVLQEQGYSGSLTSEMDGGNGQTYYNYFNFNAYGSSTSEIVGNALSYAKACGWNNPYLAIKGGAEGISDGYIDNNQDTLYYEKFNIVGGSRYWHQYMANIMAPYTESMSAYRSYFSAGLVDNAYTFKIPVYTDMGKATVIPTKSNNNNLSSLEVSNCTLNPAFNSAISTYNCSVSYDVSSVSIKANLSDSKAKLEGTGTKSLNVGDNNFELKVTAENGDVRTYKINIIRKDEIKEIVTPSDGSSVSPSEVIKNIGYKNTNNNLSGFTLGEDVSKIIVNIRKNNNVKSVKILDSKNNELLTGKISTGQKIVITTNTTETYNVIVYGDTNGDGKVSAQDFSKIKSHILKSSTLTGAYISAADVNKDGKVSAQDFSKVKSHILGASKLVQ
ncbi:MAG: cadherin-like beta sandwich domain-containing protein [Bacilli bacterium]|nr:cadherin-like beta sandwich domain-containing protein [Bacilli bacterium]